MISYKQFYFKVKSEKWLLMIGLCAVVCGILSFFDNSGVEPWVPLSAGICAFSVYFLKYFLYKDKPIVTFCEDHLVLRTGPLFPKRMILYDDIISINTKSSKEILFTIIEDGKDEVVKLPTFFLYERDQQEIIKEIKKKIKPSTV